MQKLTSGKGRESPEIIPKEIVDEINDSQDNVSENSGKDCQSQYNMIPGKFVCDTNSKPYFFSH